MMLSEAVPLIFVTAVVSGFIGFWLALFGSGTLFEYLAKRRELDHALRLKELEMQLEIQRLYAKGGSP